MVVFALNVLLFARWGQPCESQPGYRTLYAKTADSALSAVDRESAFASAIRRCPQNVALCVEYSSFLIAEGQFQRAADVTSLGLKWSTDSKLKLNRAIALYSLRKSQESLEAMKALPPSADVCFYRALNYIRLADHKSARASLQEAWSLGYRNPRLLYLLIDEDHAEGLKKQGLADFQVLLEQYPDSPWVHAALGNAAFALEKDEEARSEYEQALARDPHVPNANFRLGYLAYQAGQDEAALRRFRGELAINPEHSDAALFAGQTLKRMGRTPEAVPYFEDALKLDPGSVQSYKSLAATYIEVGRTQDAVAVLERAQDRFPEDAAFPAQLAKLFARLNRKPESERASNRMRELQAKKEKQDQAAVNQ